LTFLKESVNINESIVMGVIKLLGHKTEMR